MSETRKLFIAAEPALAASLAEQFATLGRFDTRAVDPAEFGPPWPDILLLDDRLCASAAQETVADLRRRGFDGALILICGGAAGNAGADAALARPFRFVDLVAAIDRALAQCGADPALALAEGARLTEKEAAILARLARAEGAVVAKSELLAEVWGYGPTVTTRTLETHIHRLRRKIGTDPARPRRIVADSGGYRLEARRDGAPALPET